MDAQRGTGCHCPVSWQLQPLCTSPCSITNPFHCSEYSREAALATEHKVPLCFQSTNTPPSDQCLRKLEPCWNFYCRCLQERLTWGQVKPVPLCSAHSSTASSLLHYKSSLVSNPCSFLFPGQCKCSPGMAFSSGRWARSQWQKGKGFSGGGRFLTLRFDRSCHKSLIYFLGLRVSCYNNSCQLRRFV